jgi:hypothetical protein
MGFAVQWKLAGVLLVLGVAAGCTGSDRPARPAHETAEAPTDREPAHTAPPDSASPHAPAKVPAPDPGSSTDMASIREAIPRAPSEALELIDRADALHPGDADAEERAWLRVDALVAAQQIGRARAAAETFLRRYPKSAQAERIRALTGVHLRPLGPRE